MPAYNSLYIQSVLGNLQTMQKFFGAEIGDDDVYSVFTQSRSYASRFIRELKGKNIDPGVRKQGKILTDEDIRMAQSMNRELLSRVEEIDRKVSKTSFKEDKPHRYKSYQLYYSTIVKMLQKNQAVLDQVKGADKLTMSQAFDQYAPKLIEENQEAPFPGGENGGQPEALDLGNTRVYQDAPNQDAILQITSSAPLVKRIAEQSEQDESLPERETNAFLTCLSAYNKAAAPYSKTREQESLAKKPTRQGINELHSYNDNAIRSIDNLRAAYVKNGGKSQSVLKTLAALKTKMAHDRIMLNQAVPGKPLAETIRKYATQAPYYGLARPNTDQIRMGYFANKGQNAGQNHPALNQDNPEIEGQSVLGPDEEQARENHVYSGAGQYQDAVLQINSVPPFLDFLDKAKAQGGKDFSKYIDDLRLSAGLYHMTSSAYSLPLRNEHRAKKPDQEALDRMKKAQEASIQNIQAARKAYKGKDPKVFDALDKLYLKMVNDGRILDHAKPGQPLADSVRKYAAYAPDYGVEMLRNTKPLTMEGFQAYSQRVDALLQDLKDKDPWWMTNKTPYYQTLIGKVEKLSKAMHAVDQCVSTLSSPAAKEMAINLYMRSSIAKYADDALTSSRLYMTHKELDACFDPGRINDPEKQKREQPRMRSACHLYDGLRDMVYHSIPNAIPSKDRDASMEGLKERLLSQNSKVLYRQEERNMENPVISSIEGKQDVSIAPLMR